MVLKKGNIQGRRIRVDKVVEDLAEGVLVVNIARWVVLTNYKDIAAEAPHAGAPNTEGVSPHNLGVVATLLPRGALIGVRVVELCLVDP